MIRERRERGFGLLESGIVLIVIATLAAAVVAYGGHMQINAKANSIHSDVLQIANNVEKVLANTPTLPDMNDDAVVQSLGVYPGHLLDGAGIPHHAGGGVVSMVSTGAGQTVYFVRLERVGGPLCVEAATRNYGRNHIGIVVQQGAGPLTPNLAPPPSPAAIIAECNKGASSQDLSLLLQFRK